MNIYFPQNNAGVSQPTKRRVFFSFHYQKDINRVNQVRHSWRFRHEAERESFGFYDGSIWESSKRRGDESLKALIRDGIDNTSVTCVLAGEQTWARQWVRYEIARSVVKGNGLLTVHVSELNCMNQGVGRPGYNPLDFIGVCVNSTNGKTYLCEKFNQQWRWYGGYTDPVSWPKYLLKPSTNTVQTLSIGTRHYDYALENGSENFPSWISLAAREAGR